MNACGNSHFLSPFSSTTHSQYQPNIGICSRTQNERMNTRKVSKTLLPSISLTFMTRPSLNV